MNQKLYNTYVCGLCRGKINSSSKPKKCPYCGATEVFIKSI